MADSQDTPEPFDDGDAVGYGRPPKQHRFKPGQSGNPKGRPTKCRNIKTLAAEMFARPIRMSHQGRIRKIRSDEAILERLRKEALGGDIKALQLLLNLALSLQPPEAVDNGPSELSADDKAIVQSFVDDLKGGRA